MVIAINPVKPSAFLNRLTPFFASSYDQIVPANIKTMVIMVLKIPDVMESKVKLIALVINGRFGR